MSNRGSAGKDEQRTSTMLRLHPGRSKREAVRRPVDIATMPVNLTRSASGTGSHMTNLVHAARAFEGLAPVEV
jgi:hypothetical protein